MEYRKSILIIVVLPMLQLSFAALGGYYDNAIAFRSQIITGQGWSRHFNLLVI